ncbi:MAG: fibrinogen-like YCDxxxxGGGW domain-containing protein, partial [Myxococcota bacterium]|nr:fibrinogen-like YCDxxxxGGGW domain-containing protein [Myxococcota bacterium]
MAHPVRCMTAVLLPMTVALHGCSSKGDDTGSGGDPPISEAEAEGANPGECTDGADNDGDGDFDCSDADCVGSPDCSEANTPGGCADGVDNDGDGLSDCDDPDCAGDDACITGPEGDAPGECADGVDNDEDGLTDCDDPDCADAPDCESAAVGSLDNPGQSCMDILSRGGSTGDGPYWIDADGPQGVAPVDVLCDMTTDGGGWTLMVADASMGTTEKDACEFWSVRPSGASASVTTCASQQLTAACSQNICEFDLQLDAPHEFTEVRFAGTAFSSG